MAAEEESGGFSPTCRWNLLLHQNAPMSYLSQLIAETLQLFLNRMLRNHNCRTHYCYTYALIMNPKNLILECHSIQYLNHDNFKCAFVRNKVLDTQAE